ncbi:DUF4158 domain-containing protein [Micromonospora sp. NPDC006766]|uniref:DUF4158 domain-containing protein n=1 Tax=Micromonospora sp. NPDC006766 TaxID=3154778 RepID=UPI0033D5F4D9
MTSGYGTAFLGTWLSTGRWSVPSRICPRRMVEFVARQLGVDAGSLGVYEWAGRTIERHRAEIRAHLGFRPSHLREHGVEVTLTLLATLGCTARCWKPCTWSAGTGRRRI